MRFTQQDILDRLGVAFLAASPVDDVHPVAIFDKATGFIFGGEIRKEPKVGRVSCRIIRSKPDGPSRLLCALEAAPVAGRYAVAAFEIEGRRIYARPEVACAFMRSLMTEIEAGRVPDVAAQASGRPGLCLLI